MSCESRAERIRVSYTEHRDALYAYAVSLTRNHAAAEDIVHTAVLRLLKRPLLPRNLRAYLFRSVRNLATDRWRRNADNGEALPELVDENQVALDPLLRDRLWHCLQMLSAEERDTILLKTLDGMSFHEIAVVRMRSVNTVASWYRRSERLIQTPRKAMMTYHNPTRRSMITRFARILRSYPERHVGAI